MKNMTEQYPRRLDVELSGGALASAGDSELRVLSNIAWAVRRSIFSVALLGMIGGALAYFLTYLSDEKYTSSARVMIETRVQTDTQFTPEVSGLPLSLTSLESELQLLRSKDLIENVVNRLQLHLDPEFSGGGSDFTISPMAIARQLKNSLVDLVSGGDKKASKNDQGRTEDDLVKELTIKKLLEARRIEQIGDVSAVYEIRISTKNPQKSATIANSLATEYLSVLTKMKRDSLIQSQEWLATRIGQLREKLSELSSELETHSIEIPHSAEEYATIKAQRIKAERRAKLVTEQLVQLEQLTMTIGFLREHGKVQEAIDFAFQSGALPQIASKETSIEEMLSALDNAQSTFKKELNVLNAQLAALKENIRTFKEQQTKQVQHDLVTKRIENEILVTEAIYRDFVSQLDRRAERGDYLDAGAHIIETARVAVDPSAPKRLQTSIAVMFTVILLGLIGAVLRELFQNRLRTTFEFENAVETKLSAIVPEFRLESPFEAFFANDGRLSTEALHYGKKMLASSDIGLRALRNESDSPVTLATQFFSKNLSKKSGSKHSEEDCVIISGASALPEEGKTSAILLLGTISAQAKFRTLIIDCDTVNSAYHEMSRLSSETLKHAASRPLRFVDYIESTPQEGLDILPLVGSQDSESLPTNVLQAFLSSTDFLNLLYSLADLYEVILLDTPPLLSVVEAAYLAQISHRVIFFARWNSTSRNSILQAKRELKNAGVRPSALVATRVDTKKVVKYGDTIMT